MKAEHIYVSTNSSRNDIHAFGTLYRFSSIRANELKNNDMADCRTGMPMEMKKLRLNVVPMDGFLLECKNRGYRIAVS